MADIVVERNGQEWQDIWEVDLSDLTPVDEVTDENQDIAYQVCNAEHIKYVLKFCLNWSFLLML